ncbi:MAG: hypothetical protein JOZ41_05445 [Chloroflexi bacterium]|nr:hypothetical protein [Chloroflexota bacterium]
MPSPRLARPSLRRSLIAGGAASTAYLLAQALDRRLTGNRYDDLILLGGAVSRHPRRQRVLGAGAHYAVGTILALLYDALRHSLPRLTGWRRGLLFIQVEHALTFPGTAFGTRFHPAVRRGELPWLWTWRYLWVETARHAAYGLVLGMAGRGPGDE